ncbi:MarR family winged helix-turn-helix transcriptional regulator [Embleya sp. MST-111070]|uniref:MarR family winged helix-turn-helix transcriptional regulator n=1 Tax=Embleya sp. MST-111070 TaxID=3398231 RepID=UPI003F735B7C
MTITAPPVTPRALALAHYAGRALLERVLARHGVTFHQSVTLRVVAVADGPVGRDELVGEVTGSLKESESVVRGVVEELVAAKLVEADPADATRLRLTDAGRTSYDTTTAETAGISARVYADIAPEDLAVAGRVLALITERANAELARV